jgi:hypothetical protein
MDVIHEKDFIFHFLRGLPHYSDDETARAEYFRSGEESASHLRDLLIEFVDNPAPTILEFASGYGCVTRHLTSAIPGAMVTASDIHPEAVSFLESRLGVKAALSNAIPERFPIRTKFDVVFALSFFLTCLWRPGGVGSELWRNA